MIPLGTVDAVDFLGRDGLVSLYKGRVRLRTLAETDAWRDVGDIGDVGNALPSLGVSVDARLILASSFGGRDSKLFRVEGGDLKEIALPVDTRVTLLRQGRVVAVTSGSHLRLYDREPGGPAFLDREIGPDDPAEPFMSSTGDGSVFYLSGRRRVEAWRREPGGGARFVAVVAELGLQFYGPLMDRDGGVIAVDDPADNTYRIYDIGRLSAKRGETLGDEVILSAERALTRCLTADEAAELGLLPRGVYDEKPRVERSARRHACRSTLERAAEPGSYWDVWRPLMRRLITALPTSETDAAAAP